VHRGGEIDGHVSTEGERCPGEKPGVGPYAREARETRGLKEAATVGKGGWCELGTSRRRSAAQLSNSGSEDCRTRTRGEEPGQNVRVQGNGSQEAGKERKATVRNHLALGIHAQWDSKRNGKRSQPRQKTRRERREGRKELKTTGVPKVSWGK